nr:hypothetical protein CFP56_20975 [Quercus suber]
MCRTIRRWNICGHPKATAVWKVKCITKYEGGECVGQTFDHQWDDKTICRPCWDRIETDRTLHADRQRRGIVGLDVPFIDPYPGVIHWD